jgi:hypothetical protein
VTRALHIIAAFVQRCQTLNSGVHAVRSGGEPRSSFASRSGVCICAVLIILFTLQGVLSGCTSSTGITQPQDVVFPDSNVRFQQHVLPLLQLGCAFNGCHAYFSLYQTPGLVIPGKPESSVLVQVIQGILPHTFPLQSINANHKKGMATWVREGANNN